MNAPQLNAAWNWNRRKASEDESTEQSRHLLHIVDAGLFAVICVAPFVLGGRHDLGRLVFVSLVSLTTIAWLIRQCIVPNPCWTRTAANGLLALAVGIVALQLVPLPAVVIEGLAPRIAELLPLWTPGAADVNLGTWRTLSLSPHDTTIALAMLVSYGWLFVVVAQRVQSAADVFRLLNWIAVSAVLMAGFGILQYFASNGRFFWFYSDPHRTTDHFVQGSFVNRNHFADFLVLGVGPLCAWLMVTLRRQPTQPARRRKQSALPIHPQAIALVAAMTIVTLAILLSLSRGGALALVTSVTTLGTIYLRWGHFSGKHVAGSVGLALVMLGVLSIYGYDKVAGRLDDFVDGSVETMDTNEGRRKIWQANLAAIQSGWLTGAGAGSHRAIYPVYLAKSLPVEFTHAENGYLQIATETGIGGITLVAAGMILCGTWCFRCLVHSKLANEQLYFGAVAAGLMASAVHSLVDFVWFIPACMSVTVILAACALRLSQFVQPAEQAAECTPQLARSRWFELAAAGAIMCVWCVYTLFGPAMASIHWDRYLRASVNKSQVAWQQFTALVDGVETVDVSVAERLLDVMIRHLEDAAYWDPAYERVQMRLAAKCVARFELLQQRAENAMPLLQLREAVLASRFTSPHELRAWLHKAFGNNIEWLNRAYDHAHRAVMTSPLQGEAYLQLASLCFLDGSQRNVASAYANQGLLVRPYDADVLYEAGNQSNFAGDVQSALKYWKRSFAVYGKHQLRIIQTLAGPHVPAAAFVEEFRPDWSTLRSVWTRYHRFGNEQDQQTLVDYAAEVTKRQVQEKSGAVPPEYILRWQASMYTDIGRSAEALRCLEQAYNLNPHMYAIRLSLANALIHAKRYAEAEPHVRWCLARHPEDKTLKASLVEISKHRLAGLEKVTVPLH